MSTDPFHVEAFIFVLILIVYVLTSHVIQSKKIPYIHESSISILMGIITAAIAKYVLHTQIDFSNELFFAIILPPIIFSAGYSLRKSLFFENFAMIGFLGIFGTVLGFMLISGYIILINSIFDVLTLTDILILSSVLCATDTLAANALIKVDKFPVLNAVLFGQGIINDAVAIILFGTVKKLNLDQTGGEFNYKVVEEIFLDFCYLFFFSIAFGTISGLGLSYLFKSYESINKHPIKQTSLILLNGYLTYLMGQLMGLSGIITLFTCAIIMGHYSFMNISQESQRGTGLAFQTVSYISQAFVFTYLGASILSIDSEWRAILMAFLILLSFPFIRVIMVYIAPLLFKIIGKPFILSSKQLKMCWYSGLIRGVITFALCLQINSEHQKFILTIALVIVMTTSILGSSFMQIFAKYINLEQVNKRQEDTQMATTHRANIANPLTNNLSHLASKYKNISLYKEQQGNSNVISNKSTLKKQSDAFVNFQSKYLKPFFSKKEEGELDELQMTYSMHEDDKRKEDTDRNIKELQQVNQ